MGRVPACLLVAVAVLACDRDVHHMELIREEPSRGTFHGVLFEALVERNANNSAPLLVALHGRGDTAYHFTRMWHLFPAKIELLFPLAPLPYGDGRQWFDWPAGMTDEALADAVSAAEAKLWPAIAAAAHGRKLMLAGFSQGAVLVYAMAVRHPDDILCAFPIAGRLPRTLLPRGDVRTAPVHALHGTADDAIDIDFSREAIAALSAVGGSAELHEFPGVGHTVAPAMFDDLVAHVRAIIDSSQAARTRLQALEPPHGAN